MPDAAMPPRRRGISPAMRWLDTLHRWTGGLIGLVLFVLGVSGTALLYEDVWIAVPHAHDARASDAAALPDAVAAIMAQPGPAPRSILLAGDGFGLHQVRYPHGAGAYADGAGRIVTRWSGQWQRPELWLFDLHHHLLAGDAGETVIGVAALCGLFFVVSGAILWWRTRRTFAPRLLPRRPTRSAIVRHHRDLGIVVAPLLLVSFATGALMVFRPLAIVFGPGTPAAMAAFGRPPSIPATAVSPTLDWRAIVRTAQARFPDAAVRVVTLPGVRGGPIAVRLRRPSEWVPNGRTQVWFSPATGAPVAARDARTMPRGVATYAMVYPVHTAKVGGIVWRAAVTVAGVALSLLGGLAVWSFWFARRSPRVAQARPGKSGSDILLANDSR